MTSALGVVFGLLESTDASNATLQAEGDGNFVIAKLTEALSGATVVTVENPTTLRIFRTESDRSSPLYWQ